jgi:hypothetical protein
MAARPKLACTCFKSNQATRKQSLLRSLGIVNRSRILQLTELPPRALMAVPCFLRDQLLSSSTAVAAGVSTLPGPSTTAQSSCGLRLYVLTMHLIDRGKGSVYLYICALQASPVSKLLLAAAAPAPGRSRSNGGLLVQQRRAAGVPVPPDRRGAAALLPQEEDRLREVRPRGHQGGRPQQDRAMGAARYITTDKLSRFV